jgi:sodium-dependent dicarboxylate transporter 2/3/5
MNRTRWIKVIVGLVAAGIVLALPREAFGIDGLTALQQRVMATFVFAMCFWVLEPIPIFATSVMVVVIELLFMSDKGIRGLAPAGGTLSHRDVMHNFADPIIMLFLGGLFIGAAATKYKLDVNLGRVLLRPFGSRPRWVMLGMMIATAVFSMFMSNTATTAMMLAVLMPVLRSIDPKDPARIAFALSIPFAANIGGIGTPIGTPPNAVAMKYLAPDLLGRAGGSTGPLISFGGWMLFAVPFVIVLLAATWALLQWMFRPRADRIEVDFSARWLRSGRAWIVYATSSATIILWLLGGKVHGMSSTVIAMIPVGVFTATGVLDSNDLKKISWDVLWLVAGGFALGMALEQSGLAEALVHAIPFGDLPALVVVVVACVVAYVMAGFMSNTATANLLLPVMATLAAALPTLGPVGGPVMLLLAVTFCCSMSMCLPISTPPNAMAYATGWIHTPHMARAGLLTGAVGIALLAGMMILLNMIGYFARFAPATP